MNEFNLYYAVLKYIPSSIRMESINVGIVVHAPSKEYSHLYPVKNTKRIASFDDEYNKEFFNMTIDSLRYDLNYPVDSDMEELSLGDEARFNRIKEKDFLNEKVGYLSNEFQFSPAQYIPSSDDTFNKDVLDLQRTFLYYERPKSERITAFEVKRLLSRQLRSYNFNMLERNPEIKGDFSDRSIFDYKIGDKYIKVVSFDYANSSTMANLLKSTLYDLQQILLKNNVSEIIITTNENENFSSDSPSRIFSKRVHELEKQNNTTSIKIVPLSEFAGALS